MMKKALPCVAASPCFSPRCTSAGPSWAQAPARVKGSTGKMPVLRSRQPWQGDLPYPSCACLHGGLEYVVFQGMGAILPVGRSGNHGRFWEMEANTAFVLGRRGRCPMPVGRNTG